MGQAQQHEGAGAVVRPKAEHFAGQAQMRDIRIAGGHVPRNGEGIDGDDCGYARYAVGVVATVAKDEKRRALCRFPHASAFTARHEAVAVIAMGRPANGDASLKNDELFRPVLDSQIGA